MYNCSSSLLVVSVGLGEVCASHINTGAALLVGKAWVRITEDNVLWENHNFAEITIDIIDNIEGKLVENICQNWFCSLRKED